MQNDSAWGVDVLMMCDLDDARKKRLRKLYTRRRHDGGCARIHPVFLPRTHPLPTSALSAPLPERRYQSQTLPDGWAIAKTAGLLLWFSFACPWGLSCRCRTFVQQGPRRWNVLPAFLCDYMHTTQQQLRARHGIVFIQITCRRRYGVAPELPLACAVLLRGGRAESVSFVAA